jgi:hypothetical protein
MKLSRYSELTECTFKARLINLCIEIHVSIFVHTTALEYKDYYER